MAQPHKGERKQYPARVPVEVQLDTIAHDAGYRYVSQYVADVLCRVHGFEQFVLGPDHPPEQERLTA